MQKLTKWFTSFHLVLDVPANQIRPDDPVPCDDEIHQVVLGFRIDHTDDQEEGRMNPPGHCGYP